MAKHEGKEAAGKMTTGGEGKDLKKDMKKAGRHTSRKSSRK